MGATTDPRQDIDALVNRLIASASSSNGQALADIHKRLFGYGEGAAEALSNRLLESDFQHLERPEKLWAFSAMYGLLHDIDSFKSAHVGAQIEAAGCHELIAVEIERLSSNLKSDFDCVDINGVRIHYSQQLKFPEFAKRKMSSWIAAVPHDHLAGISAIYVMPPRGCGEDVLGTYTSDFKRICFEWEENWHPRSPLTWLAAPLILPHTLFHEIGHHVLRHTNGPRDEDEERAVDHYARRLCVKASPGLSMFQRLVGHMARVVRWKSMRSQSFALRLREHWTKEHVPLRSGATTQALSNFQNTRGIGLPAPLMKLLETANGMEDRGFCSNGFRFRGLDELEIVTRNIDEADEKPTNLILFADHLPNEVQYLMPVAESGAHSRKVFRTGCRTSSGCLQVAKTLDGFTRLYLNNKSILFA